MKLNLYNKLVMISIMLLIGILFILLSLNTFFKYDDYCFKLGMQSMNPFKMMWDHYLHHDGRALSPVYLLRNLFVYYLPAEINSLLAVAALLGISYFIVDLILHLLNSGVPAPYMKLFLTLLVAISFWMAMRANLSRIIYWPIGTFYIYVSFALMFSLNYMITNRNKFYFILASSLSVLGGINIAFSFIFLYLIYYILIKKINKRDLVGGLVLLTIVFLIGFLAPGNFARASRLNTGFSFNAGEMLSNYAIILYEYVMMSKWLIFIPFFVAFLFLPFFNYESFNKKQFFKISLLLMVAALLTIVPFTILPKAASRHTSIFFQLLLFISLIMLSFNIVSNIKKNRKIYFNISVFFICGLFGKEGVRQYLLSVEMKNSMNSRIELILKSQPGSDVQLKAIIPHPGLYTNVYEDFPKEKWVYDCLSNYYNVKGVSILTDK